MSWKKLWMRTGPFRVVRSASSRFLFDSGAITGCSFSTTRQFYPIRLSEMDDFLRPQGFHQINLDHSCHEIVYGKELNPKLVMRVYTGIVGQSSRNSGQDAIRVALFKNGQWCRGSAKVLRIPTWQVNLQKRIDDLSKTKDCQQCGSPMVERVNRQDKRKFLGCSAFPKCKYTEELLQSKNCG